MAPKDHKEKEAIGERGLTLVSDRTLFSEWEGFTRREPKPARERSGPLRSRKPVSRRRAGP